MPVLSNGVVIPSMFGTQEQGRSTPISQMGASDVSLHVGEVVSKVGVIGKETVYLVQASCRNGSGGVTKTNFRCTLHDGFGSKGDHLRHSLRSRTSINESDETRIVHDGAAVLIACINGDRSQAVILTCIGHHSHTPDPIGEFLSFEFNGVTFKIAADGGVEFKVAGPTKNDGTPNNRDANNHGSTVAVAANGNISVSDGNGESITINPTEQSIVVAANTKTTTTQGAWKVVAPEASIGGGGGTPHVRVTSAGVELGGADGQALIAPVALAPNTEARLAALEAFCLTHGHLGVTPGSGQSGPALPGTAPVSAGPVAATKVKGI